jgi:carbon-monoxide dehydrogenase small subunit
VTSEVPAPLDRVWRVLDDPELLARCLPGAELTERLGDDRYRGRARVALGPIRLTFQGLAHITERDPAGHRLHVLAQGADTGGAQTQADIRLAAEAAGDGTRLRADADIYLTGRIAGFGRALAGDVSRRLFEQFADAVGEAARSGRAPEPAPARVTGTGLRTLWARLRHLLRPR